MRVHSSLIDQILDGDASLAQSGLGEAETLGDGFTDLTEGEADATPGHTKNAVYNRGTRHTNADQEFLTEAVQRIQASSATIPTSFSAIAKAASQVGPRIKDTQLAEQVKQAGDRLTRILAKTPAQMDLDGAKTAKDYADPELVPGWAKQVRADLTLIRRVVAKVGLGGEAKIASKSESIPASMTDAEVKGWIDDLLNRGEQPNKILEKLSSLSERNVFDHSMSTQYLDDNAGLLGYAFIEPNRYMDSCPDTYERITPKVGSIRAKSVKQIKACTGCSYFSHVASEKSCNLYHLPVVGSKQELLTVISNATPGSKTATAKKAALVSAANRDDTRSAPEIKTINTRPSSSAKTASSDAPLIRSASKLASEGRKETTFTVEDIAKSHTAGKNIIEIAKSGMLKVGAVRAKTVVREFIASLKGSKVKIALSQIDCTALPGKLSTANAIVGAKKCGSCSYRKGMHCGLTGGTLLSFPGMDKQASTHKVASGAKGGLQILSEYELTSAPKTGDIAINGPSYLSVEAGRAGINL